MTNISKTKIDIVKITIDCNIRNAKETISYRKADIERELERFDEMTSPKWIAQYAEEMKEAQKQLEGFYDQMRMLKFLVEEED